MKFAQDPRLPDAVGHIKVSRRDNFWVYFVLVFSVGTHGGYVLARAKPFLEQNGLFGRCRCYDDVSISNRRFSACRRLNVQAQFSGQPACGFSGLGGVSRPQARM